MPDQTDQTEPTAETARGELVLRDDQASRSLAFLPSEHDTARIWGMAGTLAQTDFVPRSIRGNVPAISAAMLTGRELGILPMRALRQINVIDGKPSPSPELMMALALKAGHRLEVVVTTRDRCVVEVHRTDWPDEKVRELEWTLEDAVDAGLCTIDAETGKARARSSKGHKLPWESYTRAMLRSRAVSEAARTWLPDVVEGASYAPEELGAQVDHRAHAVELVETARARGETFDPLEGETDEVREKVAAAMGPDDVDHDGEPQVGPDGQAIEDAEIIDDDVLTCRRCGETVPAGELESHRCDGGETVDAPTDPDPAPAGDAQDVPTDEDPFRGIDAAAHAETDAAREAAMQRRSTPSTPSGNRPPAAVSPFRDELVAATEGEDLSADALLELATGREGELAFLKDANAAPLVRLVKAVAGTTYDPGLVDLTDRRAALHRIRSIERGVGEKRKTVLEAAASAIETVEEAIEARDRDEKAAREAVGAFPEPGDTQGAATASGSEGTEQEPSGPEAANEAANEAAQSGDPDPLEERRELLRRYNAAYRTVTSEDRTKAARLHARRVLAVTADDRGFATADLDQIRELVERAEQEATNVPF